MGYAVTATENKLGRHLFVESLEYVSIHVHSQPWHLGTVRVLSCFQRIYFSTKNGQCDGTFLPLTPSVSARGLWTEYLVHLRLRDLEWSLAGMRAICKRWQAEVSRDITVTKSSMCEPRGRLTFTPHLPRTRSKVLPLEFTWDSQGYTLTTISAHPERTKSLK